MWHQKFWEYCDNVSKVVGLTLTLKNISLVKEEYDKASPAEEVADRIEKSSGFLYETKKKKAVKKKAVK